MVGVSDKSIREAKIVLREGTEEEKKARSKTEASSRPGTAPLISFPVCS
jgi:hypothetical protein